MNVQLRIHLDVDDLARAETFYVDLLGLHVGHRDGDAVELLGASAPLHLARRAAGSAAGDSTAQTRDYRRHWTPVHLDFVVADLDIAIERALAGGARREGATRMSTRGRTAQFADPFGHGFCLVETFAGAAEMAPDR